MKFIEIIQTCFKIMQTLIINILYLIGASGARALTSNSVQAFYVDGPRFCFLSHFAAPITTPYISQRAVYMYLWLSLTDIVVIDLFVLSLACHGFHVGACWC